MDNIQKIRAKSIVEDEFWILQKNNIKIGQIKALSDNEIEVKIHGVTAEKFSTIDDVKKSGLFEFTELPKAKSEPTKDVQGYPSNGLAYNAVWNVRYGLPLYTQTEDSKSWFAAGYYKINISGTWIVKFCPKLITLQRNEYKGPFKSKPNTNHFNEMFE